MDDRVQDIEDIRIKKTSHTHDQFRKTIFYCLSKSINSMSIIENLKNSKPFSVNDFQGSRGEGIN